MSSGQQGNRGGIIGSWPPHLVKADGVVRQGKVRENDKAAKRQSQRQNGHDVDLLGGKHIQAGTDLAEGSIMVSACGRAASRERQWARGGAALTKLTLRPRKVTRKWIRVRVMDGNP